MSTTIDEKIVSMEFDNQNFEQNVSQTLSTLDKLKEALNFDGAEDGLEDISKAASKVDMSDLIDSVEQVQVSFSSLDIIAATALSNITTSVMNTASKITSSVTSLISTGGKTRALNIEQAQFQLEGLGLDVEAVMQNANDAVTDTAYGLDEAAKAAAQFGASGLQAGEEMTSALRAIAGVAAMTSSDYSSIADIFTTVAGNGKLMTMQLRQLSARGLNAAATLADYLGKTEAEVRDMVSDGEISFETFYKAMDEAFGEHAKSANETFSGAMSNVRAAFSRIGADFWTPMLENMKNLMNALIPVINAFRSAISPTIDLVTGFATSVSDKLVTVMDSLFSTDEDKPTTWFSNLADALSGSDSKWSSFTKQVEDAGISMDEFQEALNEVAKSEGLDLNSLIDEYGSLQKVVESGTITSDMLTASLQNISADAASAVKATESATEVLEYYKEVVWDVWMGDYDNGAARKSLLTEAGYDYATVQSLVNKTTEDYTVTLDMLTEAELTNLGYTEEEIALIQDLSDAAAESGSDFNTLINSFTDTESAAELFQDSISNIKTFLSDIGKAVSNGWSDVFSAPSVDSVAEAIRNAVKAFKEFTSVLTISDEVGQDLAATFGGIFAAADIVFNLVGGTGKAVLKVLYETLLNVTKQLGITVSNVLDITGTIGRAIMQVDYWIKDNKTLANILNTISDVISDVVVYIIKFVGAIADLSSSGVASAVQAIADSISSILGDFERGFGEGTSALSIFTDSAVNGFTAIGEVLASGISDGITTIAQFIAKIFEGIAAISKWISENKLISKSISTIITALATAINWVTKFVQSIAESKEVQAILETIAEVFKTIGETIEQYFTEGVEKIAGFVDSLKELNEMTLDDVTSAVQEFFNSFTNDINTEKIVSAFQELPGQIISGFQTGISEGLGTVSQMAYEVFKTFANTFCDLFDIHSPSGWAIEKAKAIIQGLVLAFKSSLGELTDVADAVVDAIMSVFDKLDFGALFIAGFSMGSFGLVYKMVETIQKLVVQPMENVNKILSNAAGVLSAIKTNIAEQTKSIKYKNILTLAEAIALLAASIFLLTIPDTAKLGWAVAAVASVVVMLTAMTAILSKLDMSGTGFAKLDSIIISLGATLLLMSWAIKSIGSMNYDSYVQALQGISWLLLEMGAVIAALSFVTGLDKAGDISKAGTIFLAMSAAMLIMAQALKTIGKLDAEQSQQALTTITEVIILFAGCMAAMALINKYINNSVDMEKAGIMFLAFGGAMLILSWALKSIGGMDTGALVKGVAVIGSLTVILGLLSALVAWGSVPVTSASSLFLAFSGSMLILSVAIKIMGGLSLSDLLNGLTVISMLALVYAALVAVSKYARNVKDVGTMILELSAGLMLISLALLIIGSMSMEDATKGIIIFSNILVLFALVIAASKLAGEYSAAAGTMIMEISAGLILMAVAIKIIAGMSVDDINKGIYCIGLLSVFIAALIAISHFSGENAAKAGVMIMEVSGALLIMVACIALLSMLDEGAVKRGTNVLTQLMAMVAVLIAVSSQCKGVNTAALISITAMLLILSGAIYILAGLDPQSVLGAATGLSELLIALSIAMAVTSTFTTYNASTVESMAIMVLVIGEIGLVILALQKLGMDATTAIPIATALSELLIALSACLAILTKLQVGQIAAEQAAVGLTEFVAIIGVAILIVGAMNELTNGIIVDGIQAGINVLVVLAEGLGTVIGAFVGGIATGLLSSLVVIAASLSAFMAGIQVFLQGLQSMDQTMVDGAVALAEIVIALSVASFINGIGALVAAPFTGMAATAIQLVAFGEAMKQFAESVSGLTDADIENIKKVAEAGTALTDLANSIPNSGGLLGMIVGNNDMDDFATAIEAYGKAILSIQESFADVKVDDAFIQKMDDIAGVGDSFVTLANSIPNTGGWAATILGDNDLTSFATSIRTYCTVLSGLETSLAEFKGGTKFVNKINDMATAGGYLAELEGKLPESAGVIDALFGGGYSWDTISDGLGDFGQAMADFVTNIGNTDFSEGSQFEQGIAAAGALNELQQNLPEDVSLINKIFKGSSSTWTNLSTGLVGLAQAMADFSKKLIDSDIDWSVVTTAATKFKPISTMLGEIASVDPENISSLGDAIDSLVFCCTRIASITVTDEQIQSFIDKISAIASIDISGESITASAESIKSALEDLTNTLTTNISDKTTDFNDAITTAMSGMPKAITSEGSDVSDAVNTLVKDNVCTALEDKADSVESSAKTMAKSIATGIKAVYNDAKSAGEYVADGLVAGVTSRSKLSAAYEAGVKLGEKVNEGIKAATDENSPSKVAEQSGIYVGEGLVIGLNSMAQSVYDAGYSMGDTSVSAISSAIQQISEAVNTDLDTQPTITPVLDLSNVSEGANSISNMLNFGSNGTLMANVNSLNAQLNGKIQNGNEDLIDAIYDLKDSMNGGTTTINNINGVTYDDGSNINSAVSEIVRAARIERRT